MKKAELIPYHKRAKKLLAQLEEVKILHVRRVINARLDALAGLAVSLSVPDGEVHVRVAGRRLLTPLSEVLLDLVSKGVRSVEIAIEPIEDWQIPFLDFLERGRLSDNSAKKVEIKRGATKFDILKGVLYQRWLDGRLLQFMRITRITKPSVKYIPA